MSDHPDNRFKPKEPSTGNSAQKRRGRPARIVPANPVPRDRSRSRDERNEAPRSPSPQSHDSHSDPQAEPEEEMSAPALPPVDATVDEFSHVCINLFIHFFQKIGFSKGMVFTPQQRSKMIKEMEKNKTSEKYIKWSQQSHWEESNERNKLSVIWSSQQLNVSDNALDTLKEIVHRTSFIFADETTNELYRVMLEVLKIASGPANEEVESIKNLNKSIRKGKAYHFFGYKFSRYFEIQLTEKKFEAAYEDLLGTLVQLFKRKLH